MTIPNLHIGIVGECGGEPGIGGKKGMIGPVEGGKGFMDQVV